MINQYFYAAISKDIENQLASSSGGVFYEICKSVIRENGVVYGAAQPNPLEVRHERAETIEDVGRFRRSKYLRSTIVGIYESVKKDIEDGRKILFSGTGCQIAGLYIYLKEIPNNLITVEVVCHGVPINIAYKKYVMEEEKRHGANLKSIVFRDKRLGWKSNVIHEVYDDGTEENTLSNIHPHHAIYLMGINMATGCSSCKYANLPRIADITLGDFWKYEGRLARLNSSRGISLVVINTEMGNIVFNSIKSSLLSDEVDEQEAIDSCRHLTKAPFLHANQRAFRNLINQFSYEIVSGICSKYGKVTLLEELKIATELDEAFVFEVFYEDTHEIVYYVDKNGILKGIVTFGRFIDTYKEGKKWINNRFKYVCIDDDNIFQNIDNIFATNSKINRIPVLDTFGHLIAEIKRDFDNSGSKDSRKYLLPFLKLYRNKHRSYMFVRPRLLDLSNYTKEEAERITNNKSFQVLSGDINKNEKELRGILGSLFSIDYIEQLKKIPPLVQVGKRYRHLDSKSTLINVLDGYRKTVGQPQAPIYSIHIYGRCGVFGYAVEDSDTLPSCLQKMVEEYNICVISHSTYGAEDEFIFRNLLEDILEGIIKTNDMIILYMGEFPFMKNASEFGLQILDTTDFFHQNLRKNNVQFYDKPGHMNAEGYGIIAKYIFESLKSLLEMQRYIVKKTDYFLTNNNMKTDIYFQEYINSIVSKLPPEWEKKENIGAIVMNCNPFTKGHQYLIEYASKKEDILLVFVLEEDISEYKFNDRLNMVKQGIADLDNVYVYPSGKYMVSTLTMPEYFFKESQMVTMVDMTTDVGIFGRYIAPEIHIKRRYVGSEPKDKLTQEYNLAQKRILEKYGISVIEVERKKVNNDYISAKKARELIKNKDMCGVKEILPSSTINYLIEIGEL